MKLKDFLINQKKKKEIEKRNSIEEQFDSLTTQSTLIMFMHANSRCTPDRSLNKIKKPKSDSILTNNNFNNNNNNNNTILKTSHELTNSSPELNNEIEKIVKEHLQMDLIDDLDSNNWQLFHKEGEIIIYKRIQEHNVYPLKAIHKVYGITAHEMCKYYFSPYHQWKKILVSGEVIEKLSNETLIFYQLIKRVMPFDQRDTCFWSHMTPFESQRNKELNESLKDWIVVNYSTKHENAPEKIGIIRIQQNVSMICSTEILNKDKLNDLSSLTRNEICCHITYVSQVNPKAEWVPPKALLAVYKHNYPKFLKEFGDVVVEKTAKKPISF
jgi:collagen type IV alpha-3-binding protein